MNLYDCKLNQVVVTGDSYGMSPCLVVAEKHYDEEYGFDIVTFLDLTNGLTHDSGGKVGSGFRLDDCHLVETLSPAEAGRIKEVWGFNAVGR
jgi:hypothetical protein